MKPFPDNYKALNTQIHQEGAYTLIPIRSEDRNAIREWRNSQIYHLRQAKPLSPEDQDRYFDNVVRALFEPEQPNQILFSFLKGDECIAYGGLVHINWIDKNAEVSFVMNTALEKESFHENWGRYLDLLEKVAFEDLEFHKLYVYAFDLRPHLYEALERKSYFLDAQLKDHCFFDGSFKDVVIYSKLNGQHEY